MTCGWFCLKRVLTSLAFDIWGVATSDEVLYTQQCSKVETVDACASRQQVGSRDHERSPKDEWKIFNEFDSSQIIASPLQSISGSLAHHLLCALLPVLFLTCGFGPSCCVLMSVRVCRRAAVLTWGC